MPETGRVAPGAAPCGRAEWAPESRPQLEELRSGEWVTEPGRTAWPPATGPARLARGAFMNFPG